MPSRSNSDTISTSVVFFDKAMNSLASAGSEMRSAWGRTISQVARQ